jgi:phosphotriesterase-related protein
MKRRGFLQAISAAAVATVTLPSCGASRAHKVADERAVMTVRGRVAARELGVTLTHEHALASFQPYAEWVRAPNHYDRNAVIERVLPHLERIRALGCRTFVDATAVGLARDPALLRQLSERSGLHILTVTGNYAAFDNKFLPDYVRTDSTEELAERWIREWNDGIDGTGVRPGFIKLGFNGGPLSDVEKKLIRAAALAHRATGLTIGAHTGPAIAAYEELAILGVERVDPSAWIWIHAQNEKDPARYEDAARRGAWISLDGVSPESLGTHLERITTLRDKGLLGRVLVSQDAGWYWVGEPDGGKFRSYDTVFTKLIPALRTRGFAQAEIDTLFVTNPASAFAIQVRDA